MSIFSNDFNAYSDKRISMFQIVKLLLINVSYRVCVNYRIQQIIFQKGFIKLALIIRNRNYIKYGIEIGLNTKIGPNLKIHHPNGIVIGEGSVLGENIHLYQQVTIGQRKGKYPIIRDNVAIYPHSIVLGGIVVGENAVIAAGSRVLKNVKSGEHFITKL